MKHTYDPDTGYLTDVYSATGSDDTYDYEGADLSSMALTRS